MSDQAVAAPEPWPGWLADLDPDRRIGEILNAHAARVLGMTAQDAPNRLSYAEASSLLSRLLDEARQQAPRPSAEHSQAIAALTRLALEDPMTDWVPGNHAYLAMHGEMEARREHAAGALETIARLGEMPPREPQGGNPAAEVPSEPVIDALTRVREWAAAEPSGLMLRRDVVGTLDRVLAMSPERAAELADYRGRIAKAVALLHQSSEYAISDALAGHLTRILSDPPRTGSGPSGPTQ